MAYTTKKSLLRKVREGDEIGWLEFYRTYRPLILRRGMDFKLRPQELEELVQKVMVEFFRKDLLETKFDIDNIPPELTFRYDSGKGRFRDFLRRVVTNHACKILRDRRDRQPLDEELCRIDPDAGDDARWAEEWRHHLLTEALKELRSQVEPITFQAFEMYALKEHSAQETAEFLTISVASVYTARSRCVARLKNIIKDLENRP